MKKALGGISTAVAAGLIIWVVTDSGLLTGGHDVKILGMDVHTQSPDSSTNHVVHGPGTLRATLSLFNEGEDAAGDCWAFWDLGGAVDQPLLTTSHFGIPPGESRDVPFELQLARTGDYETRYGVSCETGEGTQDQVDDAISLSVR